MFHLLIWILLGLFVACDFSVVHFFPAQPTGNVMKSILAFFIDVNQKALGIVNSLFDEVKNHWVYWIAAGFIYFILVGSDLVLFVKILIGYLILRMVIDTILKVAVLFQPK